MMSFKFKLLAAATAAFALPAAAQVTGTRLPAPAEAQAGVKAEVQAGVEAETSVAPDPAAEVEAGAQADVQADAATGTQTGAPAEAAPAADAQAAPQADAQAQAGGEAGAVTLATAADIRAGVTVEDPQGGVVGTVESVEADGVVVSTGSARAKLPAASFGKNDRGLVISLTRAELEAAAAAAAAQNPG